MASITKRPDGRWRARYRDAEGREHARHFERKIDGQRWLDEVTAAVVTGQYVDPKAGRLTFREYAEQWRQIQQHRPGTAGWDRQVRNALETAWSHDAAEGFANSCGLCADRRGLDGL